MDRKLVQFEIVMRTGTLTHDTLADELERIAKLVREDYERGELFRESEYRGWWDATGAST